jgi:hypothetical protein
MISFNHRSQARQKAFFFLVEISDSQIKKNPERKMLEAL